MQGKKNYSEKLFVSFQLSDRIPKENFYRRLGEALDMQFLYRDTSDLYGKTGNPSIDPAVFFKFDAHRISGKHHLGPAPDRALLDSNGHSLLFRL